MQNPCNFSELKVGVSAAVAIAAVLGANVTRCYLYHKFTPYLFCPFCCCLTDIVVSNITVSNY